MHRSPVALCMLLLAASAPAVVQAQDVPDALNLQIAPEQAAAPVSPWRAAIEAGGGRANLRDGTHRDAKLFTLDLRYSARLSESWHWSLSDRYDYVSPALLGQDESANSLRELYASWQEAGSALAVEAGRINYREGPAYGFNPTDYFRRGALRTISTADPIALRERRLGTAMVRATRLWDEVGVTLALAPKLDDGPSRRAAAIDLGATNDIDRAMLGANLRIGPSLNGQTSVLLQRGHSPVFGGSFTALAGNALVLFGEVAVSRFTPLLERVVPQGLSDKSTAQAALGATYTFENAFSLTVEADFNGAGLDERQFQTVLAQGPAAYQRYFWLTQSSQELGARRAWLVYASQKGLGLKQLDLTGFVRLNALDSSWLSWAELRYHWSGFDGVLQWQRANGGSRSEFGVLPYRDAVQLSVVFFL